MYAVQDAAWNRKFPEERYPEQVYLVPLAHIFRLLNSYANIDS